jgi:hypothetical protein
LWRQQAGLIDWDAHLQSTGTPAHALAPRQWAFTWRAPWLLHLHVTSDDGTQLPAASGTAIIPRDRRAIRILGRNHHPPAGDELKRAPFLPIIATYPLSSPYSPRCTRICHGKSPETTHDLRISRHDYACTPVPALAACSAARHNTARPIRLAACPSRSPDKSHHRRAGRRRHKTKPHPHPRPCR